MPLPTLELAEPGPFRPYRPDRYPRPHEGRSSGRLTRAHRWERRYVAGLVGIDASVALVAAAAAWVVRLSTPASTGRIVLSALLPVLWVGALAVCHAYDTRFLFVGPEEYQRTLMAGLALTSAVAVISYGAALDVARGYVALALPAILLLDLLCRYLLRKWVHRRRVKSARFMQRVLAVGYERSIARMARELHRHRYHGMRIVGACLPPHRPYRERIEDIDVPVYGRFGDVVDAVEAAGADTVAVLSCPELDGTELRRLAWQLEESDVDLVVAPALIDVAGPRTTIRPVEGLPLVHVDHPSLSGGRRVAKELFDRTSAGLALLMLAPLMLAIGIAIRLTSQGPALFRQTRVGKNGETFTVLKFRSMYVDAEARLAELRCVNENDGVLFKMREDPRVTRLGRWLRRYSLDELPQLFNVLAGQMSLVGPRPPLPSEVEQYAGDVNRRLVVKPGLTGLWQVSGRSDLSWEESVRIDLRYVENWSLALDAMILWRTVFAVLRSQGAY
jgi:exopolysaccharide biosynthesis polyprenyl glycosylphosphotransferase